MAKTVNSALSVDTGRNPLLSGEPKQGTLKLRYGVQKELNELLGLLRELPDRRVRKTLVRCVELDSLIASGKPDFLFTSGKADRYNVKDIDCLYFAEDEETARAEHRCQDTPAQMHRPVCMFFANVSLNVVDLTDKAVRKSMGFTEKDLAAAWERARNPTRSQLLGTAVNKLATFAAIRYPSDAARAHGFAGNNMVVFRGCVRRSCFVRVLGPGRRTLQCWP
jgi:RES domain-containing protein